MIVAICKSCNTINHNPTTIRCKYCGSEFIEARDILEYQIKHTYNRDVYDSSQKESELSPWIGPPMGDSVKKEITDMIIALEREKIKLNKL